MQAVEALTRLIQAAEHELSLNSFLEDLGVELTPEEEKLAIATSICQAMLNTAIPVARYRTFVEIDQEDQPRRTKFQEAAAATSEFTLCSVDMKGIISGLIGVSTVPHRVKVTVWEQKADGVEMLSGYQGLTNCRQYREFVKGLDALEHMPTVQ